MPGKGHNNYGGRVLIKDLEAQGFEVDPNNRGRVVVKAPDGVGQQFFHVSSFEKGTPAILTELKGIGFKIPPERFGATPPKEGNGTKVKGEQPGEKLPCRVKECPYPGGKPIHLGRHVTAKIAAGDKAHMEAYPEKVAATQPAAPGLPPAKGTSSTGRPAASPVIRKQMEPESPVVRMRNKLEQLQKALQVANEAAEWMMTEYTKMAEENKDLKSKTAKFEKFLGKGLEIL